MNFPIGFLEGALNTLGINCKVTVDIKLPKECMFIYYIIIIISILIMKF